MYVEIVFKQELRNSFVTFPSGLSSRSRKFLVLFNSIRAFYDQLRCFIYDAKYNLQFIIFWVVLCSLCPWRVSERILLRSCPLRDTRRSVSEFCITYRSLIDKLKKKELVIEPVVGPFEHSEGPHWDHHTQKLYFVDIEAQKICRFSPISKHLTCIYIDKGPVGVAVPVEGESDKLVAGVATEFVLVNWDDRRNCIKPPLETLALVDTDRNGTRWNDGKVDSSGRFWGGWLKISFLIKQHFTELTLSRQVAAFDFEPISGTISNKRIVFDLQKNNISGLPDGMTIDTNGNLWIAAYNGGAVINVNPRTGKVIRSVELPVSKVTSVMFGGPLLDTLYVTTSKRGLNPEEQIKQPYAGYVFAVHGLGVHGFTANSFKL